MRAYLDPLALVDEDGLEKFSHLLNVGQRVSVRHRSTKEVHRGKITGIGSDNSVYVQLDSGHLVSCLSGEVTPEDFPEGERAPTKTAKRAGEPAAPVGISDSLAKFDALGFVDDGGAGATGDSNAFAKRARFSVGDSVKDKTGRVGTVTRAMGEAVEIEFGKGETGICLVKHLEAA